MAGAVNPFTNVQQSQRLSQFVDESIPAELMLRAGIAKQSQQDKAVDFVNTIGMFDQDAIRGGDTDLVEKTKQDVNKFVDDNLGRDLTGSQAQADAFKFARGIQQNKQLKQARSNFAAVQKYQAAVQEMGEKAFSPSVRRSNRLLQTYIDSGKQGEEIGILNVEEALNLHAKEETYVNDIKDSGAEWFTKDIKVLKENGLYGKAGWSGVEGSRIGQVMMAAVPDYRESIEGRQALQIYGELKRNGNLPPGVTNENQYLADRLLRTGMEFAHMKTKVKFEKGLNKALGVEETAPSVPPIVAPGSTVKLGDVSLEEARDKMNDPSTSPIQKQAYQSIIDKATIGVNSTRKGQEITRVINETVDKLKMPTAEELTAGYIKNNTSFSGGKINSLGTDLEKKPEEHRAVVNKLGQFLQSNLKDVIKDKALAKDNEFFDLMSGNNNIGSLLDVNDTDPANPYVFITGTDVKVTPEELGLTSRELIDNSKMIRTVGIGAKRAHSKTNLFVSDDWDKIFTNTNEFEDLLDEEASGTSTQLTSTARIIEPKAKALVEEAFKSANFGNFEAVNVGDLEEVLDGKGIEALLANIGGENVSVRADTESRMLEVTVKTGAGEKASQKTFKVKEKAGMEGRDQTLDRIFEIVTGESGAGQKAGAVGNFSRNTTASFTPLTDLTGVFKNSLPQGISPTISVKLNEDKSINRDSYVMGQDGGVSSMEDLVRNLSLMQDNPIAKELVMDLFVKHAYKNGLSTDKVSTLVNMVNDKELGTPTDSILLESLLDEKLTAGNYDEALVLAQLLSLNKQ